MAQLEPANSKNTLPPDFVPPDTYAAAMAHARELSRGFDYLRIDFMSCGKDLYAGEITVYPNAGLTWAKDDPATDINALTNAGWNLLNSHFFTARHSPAMAHYRRRLAAALSIAENEIA